VTTFTTTRYYHGPLPGERGLVVAPEIDAVDYFPHAYISAGEVEVHGVRYTPADFRAWTAAILDAADAMDDAS
jgi:hypothetical protein